MVWCHTPLLRLVPSLRLIRTIQSWRIPLSAQTRRPISLQIRESIATVSKVEVSVAAAEYLEGRHSYRGSNDDFHTGRGESNHPVTELAYNAADLPLVLFERLGPLESR